MRDRLCLAVMGAALLFFAGCKSVPEAAVAVEPLDLLDNESSFYIAVPKAADPELITRLVKNNVGGISDGDAELIAGRIDKVYCGLNRRKNFTELQASLAADVPVKLVTKALTKKNGWDAEPYSPEGSESGYTVYSNGSVQLAFPSGKNVCIGRNLTDMLATYDALSQEPDGQPGAASSLDRKLYAYLRGADSEIRFFANRPQSFLTILTGAQLDLSLIDVSGCFVSDPSRKEQYLLSLNFRFRNEKFLKAGKGLLTLAFGLTDSQSVVIGNSELEISGIKIKKDQLYKLFAL